MSAPRTIWSCLKRQIQKQESGQRGNIKTIDKWNSDYKYNLRYGIKDTNHLDFLLKRQKLPDRFKSQNEIMFLKSLIKKTNRGATSKTDARSKWSNSCRTRRRSEVVHTVFVSRNGGQEESRSPGDWHRSSHSQFLLYR